MNTCINKQIDRHMHGLDMSTCTCTPVLLKHTCVYNCTVYMYKHRYMQMHTNTIIGTHKHIPMTDRSGKVCFQPRTYFYSRLLSYSRRLWVLAVCTTSSKSLPLAKPLSGPISSSVSKSCQCYLQDAPRISRLHCH